MRLASLLALLGIALGVNLNAGCTRARPLEDRARCAPGEHESDVHACGLLEPSSPDFHAKLLRSRNYDFALCQSCHGENFDGGKAKASCLKCHEQRPDACNTCHSKSGPQTGAHLMHTMAAPAGAGLACRECHTVPESWSTPGHILDDRGQLDPPPAEVVFGDTARLLPYPRGLFGGPAPQYAAGTCSNVYCHAPRADDAAATNAAPRWRDKPGRSCASCHGQPPADHPVGECSTCHAAVIDGAGQLKTGALHLDGKVSLGDDSGTCSACHGTLGGAHASHLAPPHKLANPITCSECHLLPTAVASPGHLDQTPRAEVFVEGSIGPIAGAHGALPQFDATAQRCSGVACHGSGDKLARDTTPTILRTPTWIPPPPGTGPASCGACHGLPPADGVHDARWRLQQCSQCHDATIDPQGAFRYTNGLTTHADGHVDVP